MAATWWSVLVETAADDGQSPPEIDGLLDVLTDALHDEHSGIVSGDARGYSARINLEATEPVHGALWAVHMGCGIVVDAAMKAGLPDWRVVRIEAVRDDAVAREVKP